MTTLPQHPASFAPAWAPNRVSLTRRWEHALIVLGICLPIPVFAATGLSIPLPTTVERIAAALVPWAGPSTLDENEALATGIRGTIVRAPGERTPATPGLSTPSPASNPRGTDVSGGSSGSGSKPKHGAKSGSGSGDTVGGSGDGGTTSGGGGPTTQPPGSEPAPSGSPVQGVVDQVTGATDPVVGGVEDTVTGVVDTAGDTVGGIVSGLGK